MVPSLGNNAGTQQILIKILKTQNYTSSAKKPKSLLSRSLVEETELIYMELLVNSIGSIRYDH